MIETKPVVKSQSASATPGIATALRSVFQVPMTDNVPTVSGEVSASASVFPARVHVSSDEDDKEEDEESGHDDDEESVDNHPALTKGVVRGNSPGRRPQREDIWKHVSRIVNHDFSDHAMKTDCTHVCIYRLTDAEGGEKGYCNKPLKLSGPPRSRKHLGAHRQHSHISASWSTSAALAHFVDSVFGFSEEETDEVSLEEQ